jgi:putative ABC transport system permease protein
MAPPIPNLPKPGLFSIASLAWRDYLHEWPMSLCAISALAAVLAPLLVLFGLKFGIVDALTRRLTEDPTTRQIRVIGQGSFNAKFFRDAHARPGVGFIVPNTRFLAASARLVGKGGMPVVVELVPTAEGDPLFRGAAPSPRGVSEIVVTDSVLNKLGLAPGDGVTFSLGRTLNNDRQEVSTTVRVVGALSPQRAQGDLAYVSLDLLVAVEDWRDGYVVPAFGWAGMELPAGERMFASFRLFARTIEDVAAVRQWLLSLKLDVITRLDEIETVQAINRALTLLFSLVASLAAIGYGVSFAIGLLAATTRKRRDLSTLRLLGFHARGIALFPAVQALTTAVAGCLTAYVMFAILAWVINTSFAEVVGADPPPCRLLPLHIGCAVITTVLIALAASIGSGLRAASIQPSDGLREE